MPRPARRWRGAALASATPLLACGSVGTPPDLVVAVAPQVEDQPPMVRIAAGRYPIGDDRREAAPAHALDLAAFEIDAFEVTNARFVTFLNALHLALPFDAEPGAARAETFPEEIRTLFVEGAEGTQRRPLVALDDEHADIGVRSGLFVVRAGRENHPASEVTWDGARLYCRWRGARLPTEVEWEAAARGREGRRYPWGNEPPDATRAVFGRGAGETSPVGSLPAGATPEGVFDLAGNLAEWTSTQYWPYPYDPRDGREDLGEASERITRGGDHVYDSSPEALTTTFREGYSRAFDRGHRHIGFRCARDARE